MQGPTCLLSHDCRAWSLPGVCGVMMHCPTCMLLLEFVAPVSVFAFVRSRALEGHDSS